MQDDRCTGDKHMHNKISNYTTNNIYDINIYILLYRYWYYSSILLLCVLCI